MNLPAGPEQGEVNSRAIVRVPALERIEDQPTHQPMRVSALERIEDGINQDMERVSALERIVSPQVEQQRASGILSSLQARLQEVEVQYVEEEHLSPDLGGGSIPIQGTQRTPASLRLGLASVTRKRNPPRAASTRAIKVVPSIKKVPSGRVSGAVKSRGTGSPLQGVRTSKQRLTSTRGRPPALAVLLFCGEMK
ncbi:unnamed protein product [Brassica rapa]|uniref:Uncharacterized protein n=1 Tax=Brassica campestris TaxID=3711 RepID=A0A3P6B4X3_BRACM|nr:unnamed protein product [Brassica rapa]VDC95473.1 unnamed protein product [Brassica rapa]